MPRTHKHVDTNGEPYEVTVYEDGTITVTMPKGIQLDERSETTGPNESVKPHTCTLCDAIDQLRHI